MQETSGFSVISVRASYILIALALILEISILILSFVLNVPFDVSHLCVSFIAERSLIIV